MFVLADIAGAALLLIVLWDAFETIVLPRRVTRRFRLTRLFYRSTWKPWLAITCLLSTGKRRETLLSFFGPLSLLLLLSVWATGLILGFAILQWGGGSAIRMAGGIPTFRTDVYLSGTSFFTLGMGDVVPNSPRARMLTMVEAGMGFGFLAMVIGYLPVIYQAFSRREVSISMLDARAGSPPTALELLRRHSHDKGMEVLRELLHEWERWSAELLESHLSYPVLAYFRSQHNNQSWLSALTAILDTSALAMAGLEGMCQRQAELTFAMARHAVVDLAQVFSTPPEKPATDRLPPAELVRLRGLLGAAGLRVREGTGVEQRLIELRRMYEPYVDALARYLALSLPPWMVHSARNDNWQTSAWEKSATSPMAASGGRGEAEHF